MENKSVCITNTEKQDILTLFRQDREFDLKKKFYRWGKHTFLFTVPNTLHIFPPRSIVLFRNYGKSSLERCEIVSVGDLGRPSRSSGPPHHSRAEDEAVDTYVNRVTTTTTTTTTSTTSTTTITLLKQMVFVHS